MQSWKKRFFILRGSQLSYYEDEREYELLCIIPLCDVNAVAEVRTAKRQNVFGLVTAERTFYLQAENREEMTSWISVLKQDCFNLRVSKSEEMIAQQPGFVECGMPKSLPSSNPILDIIAEEGSPVDSEGSSASPFSEAVLSPEAQLALELAEVKCQGFLKIQKKYKVRFCLILRAGNYDGALLEVTSWQSIETRM